MALDRMLTLDHRLVTGITSLTVLLSRETIQASQLRSRSLSRSNSRLDTNQYKRNILRTVLAFSGADTGFAACIRPSYGTVNLECSFIPRLRAAAPDGQWTEFITLVSDEGTA